MIPTFSSITRRQGATVAGIFSVALSSVLLLCGAGSVPIENLLPQGAMQGDLNAGAHNITNAGTIMAASYGGTGTNAFQPASANLTTYAGVTPGAGVTGALANATNSVNGLPTYHPSNLTGMMQGLLPGASGNSNLINLRHSYNALYMLGNNPQPGSTFTWIVTGDSVAGFKPGYILQILENQFGTAGYQIGWGQNLSGVTANTTDFGRIPSGFSYSLNASNTTLTDGFSINGAQAYGLCDTFKVYFPSTADGASVNTFKIQSNLNGAGWNDETNVTLALNVSQTTTGTTTTGNTTCDTYYSAGSAVTPTGTFTNGSNVVTGISSMTGLAPGYEATSSLSGLPAGTAIESVSGNTATLSANFTGTTGSGTLTVIPVAGAVATVVKSSPGLYEFRVVRQAGAFTVVGTAMINSKLAGIVPGSLAQGGISVANLDKTAPSILGPIMYDVNPTLVSFEVKDSVALFNSDLTPWQTLMGNACPNADFLDLGSTPTWNNSGGSDDLAQGAILKANAFNLNHFFFDSYGVLGSYQSMATMGIQSTVQNNPLSSSGTTLTLPAGALSTYASTNAGQYPLLAIWDAGTNPLASGNHFEIVQVQASLGSNQFTINRGYGTTAVSHAQGSQIASGWTLEGTHPTAACNEFLAAMLYQQLGFGAFASLPANEISGDPDSIGNSTESGISANLGSGTSNVYWTLRSNGSSNIVSIKGRNMFNQGTFPDGVLSLNTSNGQVYLSNSYGHWLGFQGTDPGGNGFFTETNGPLIADTAGYGFQAKEGSNAKQGTATLTAGTVTVSDTAVTANSRIFLTTQSPSGTVGTPYVSARTAGTSFTITSTSGSDTSTVGYEIFEPAP